MEATTFAEFWVPVAWCAVGVPLSFGYFLRVFGALLRRHPIEANDARHGIVVLPTLFLFVVSGAACLWWLLEADPFSKAAFCVLYGVVMAVGLLLIAAQASGDM